jgi:hypothetical protein
LKSYWGKEISDPCGPQKLNSSVDTPIGNETVG